MENITKKILQNKGYKISEVFGGFEISFNEKTAFIKETSLDDKLHFRLVLFKMLEKLRILI